MARFNPKKILVTVHGELVIRHAHVHSSVPDELSRNEEVKARFLGV